MFQLTEELNSWSLQFENLQSEHLSNKEAHEKEVARLKAERQETETKNGFLTKELERINGLLNVFEQEDQFMNEKLR